MDEDLVVLAQKGDQQAFESLTIANHHRLFKVANGILRDPHLAEDATQQAFLDIWQDIRRLRDVSKFEGWSYRLLVRACYAESRRHRRKLPDLMSAFTGDSVVADESRSVADRDQLERGFERLSLEQRAVVVLHYYFDLPQDRVAETLGIRPGTVRSRLHRAMQTLRAALEADARPPSSAPTALGNAAQRARQAGK
jgi:RNA polymerase sigma-70 factor (ECF subfamily)